jgi:hypothetical protein
MGLRPDWRGTGSLSTIGLEVALSIVLPLVAGNWADGKLHTGPWLALLGFGFGFAAAVRAMVRAWREMQAIAAKEEREQGNPAPTFPYAEPPKDERDRAVPQEPPGDATSAGPDDEGKPDA